MFVVGCDPARECPNAALAGGLTQSTPRAYGLVPHPLVADVEAQLHVNDPWKYKLSERYYEPAVTTAVAKIAAEEHATVAA